jgi:hypothetical protein
VKRFTILILILIFIPVLRISAQNAPITTAGIVTTTGTTVVVEVRVQNFNNIAGFSLKLRFDPAIGIVTSVTKGPWANIGNFATPNIDNSLGFVKVGWINTDILTLPANTVLFTVSFTKVTSGTSTLTWLDGPSCEYSDFAGNALNDSPLATYYQNGSITFSGVTKTLNITAFLEGLYAGSSSMNQAQDENGPHWPASVADHITVELHNADNYSIIDYTVSNIPLNTDGTATVTIPGAYSGNYYITIKHRNSIETTTATAKSFSGSTIAQSFTTPAQVFGGNLQAKGGGIYAIYGGDVNQDGYVDSGDQSDVETASSNFIGGYVITDINGDGYVDSSDQSITETNSSAFVGSVLP